MIADIIQNIASNLGITTGELLAVLGYVAVDYFLHWAANHFAGKEPTGPLGTLVRVLTIIKKITPGGLGRATAKITNPESLAAKDSPRPEDYNF